MFQLTRWITGDGDDNYYYDCEDDDNKDND